MPLGFEPRAFFCFQFEPDAKNSVNEGHGFSRAALSRNDEGFKACVRTALSQLSPVGECVIAGT